jgi:hypothetical protein
MFFTEDSDGLSATRYVFYCNISVQLLDLRAAHSNALEIWNPLKQYWHPRLLASLISQKRSCVWYIHSVLMNTQKLFSVVPQTSNSISSTVSLHRTTTLRTRRRSSKPKRSGSMLTLRLLRRVMSWLRNSILTFLDHRLKRKV